MEKALDYGKRLEAVMNNTHMREDSLPWSDPHWQQMVCARLREVGKYRDDAQKLAIIKEVFGGK